MTLAAAYERAAALLLDARDVLVCAHVDPDGDAIGSMLGLRAILLDAGVDVAVRLASDRSPKALYAFLPGFDALQPVADTDAPDVVVALDTTDRERLGDAAALLDDAREVIVMDHHPDTREVGTVHVLDATAAAVGLMIWELCEVLRVKPSRDVATCLYTALATDTGRFQHDNTDARALHRAAEMVEAGADPTAVATAVYQSRSPAAMRLIGLVISRITAANDGQVAYSWFDPEDLETTGAKPDEVEDLVDWVRMGAGPQAVFLVKIGDGSCRLSLRARGAADVGAAARLLGGGGHRAAAGATVSGSIQDALDAILPLLPGGE
jgi:phosphoesterase RecJ-like protein